MGYVRALQCNIDDIHQYITVSASCYARQQPSERIDSELRLLPPAVPYQTPHHDIKVVICVILG